MTRQERLTKMIEQGYSNGWAWADIAKRIVEIEAMTPNVCKHKWEITITPYVKDDEVIRNYRCDKCGEVKETKTPLPAWVDVLKDIPWGFKPAQSDPPATFAESVAIGFPVQRTDGLVSLHLGGTYTLLSKAEARRLSSDLFMAGHEETK